MNKFKENILIYEVSKLKQQHIILLEDLNPFLASPLPSHVTSKGSKGVGKPPTYSS